MCVLVCVVYRHVCGTVYRHVCCVQEIICHCLECDVLCTGEGEVCVLVCVCVLCTRLRADVCSVMCAVYRSPSVSTELSCQCAKCVSVSTASRASGVFRVAGAEFVSTPY